MESKAHAHCVVQTYKHHVLKILLLLSARHHKSRHAVSFWPSVCPLTGPCGPARRVMTAARGPRSGLAPHDRGDDSGARTVATRRRATFVPRRRDTRDAEKRPRCLKGRGRGSGRRRPALANRCRFLPTLFAWRARFRPDIDLWADAARGGGGGGVGDRRRCRTGDSGCPASSCCLHNSEERRETAAKTAPSNPTESFRSAAGRCKIWPHLRPDYPEHTPGLIFRRGSSAQWTGLCLPTPKISASFVI